MLEDLIQQKIHTNHIEVITFQKRIIKYRDHLVTFLYHMDVNPDNNNNNISEQAIRNIKIKLKVSGMFKSTKGARTTQSFVLLPKPVRKPAADP